jgi:MFS superfamily sulfate permease-like transporter
VSGLLGGLPMTAVIVSSSANVNSGGRTKMSAIFHGFLLLICLLAIPSLLNKIPLSCLAAILLTVGYKLAKVSLFKHMWHKGLDQFIPFVITIIAVVLTDLLIGVGIGMLVGVFYILRTNLRNPYFYTIAPNGEKNTIRIKLAEEVSFLNKAAIQITLTSLPKGSDVIIDGSHSRYIDPDVLEIIQNYKHNAYTKGIIVQLQDIKERYDIPPLKELDLQTLIKKITMFNEKKKNGSTPAIDAGSIKLAQKQSYDALIKGNSNWVATRVKEDPEYFTKLAKGQQS